LNIIVRITQQKNKKCIFIILYFAIDYACFSREICIIFLVAIAFDRADSSHMCRDA